LQEAGSHTIQHCEPRQAREGAAVSKMLHVYGKARPLVRPWCFLGSEQMSRLQNFHLV